MHRKYISAQLDPSWLIKPLQQLIDLHENHPDKQHNLLCVEKIIRDTIIPAAEKLKIKFSLFTQLHTLEQTTLHADIRACIHTFLIPPQKPRKSTILDENYVPINSNDIPDDWTMI